MLKKIRNKLEKLKHYDKITGMSEIIRRYFVMNAFDGALTIFGVLLGTYSANITDPAMIIRIGLTACFAVGISGLWGAFLTESAEGKREIRSLERAMHRKLDNTEIGNAYNTAKYITSIVYGLSPFLAGLIILIPFGFPSAFPITIAYYASFILAIGVFFFLGIYLGAVSKDNIIISGLKLVTAGLVCMIVAALLGLP